MKAFSQSFKGFFAALSQFSIITGLTSSIKFSEIIYVQQKCWVHNFCSLPWLRPTDLKRRKGTKKGPWTFYEVRGLQFNLYCCNFHWITFKSTVRFSGPNHWKTTLKHQFRHFCVIFGSLFKPLIGKYVFHDLMHMIWIMKF